ncbi:DUF2268 domain-containing protein [Aciduricibacillus chroicocephali]|uniref:DUF2268 domain-containing protein n=1 Tax=Aciduricibacillus chroicocephali TaxID=3054939 RepID=A0ABY9KXK6_9BACI|nr:DUF2268 domain-containing protein [Bacillaceae bacterium 44XB]
MKMIRTEKWIDKDPAPLAVCQFLEPYFKGHSAEAICDHLVRHGMYRDPEKAVSAIVKFENSNTWRLISNEANKLKEKWNGHDLPIFILPADEDNTVLRDKLKGRSGIAFKDKLLLFITPQAKKKDLQTLLAHEYHHVIRLNSLDKKENIFTLLDSIVMEGLAENAVRELYGEKRTAYWTSLYNNKEINRIWKNFIRPNLQIPKTEEKHHRLLHGHGKLPEMAGYCCGYVLVKKYMEKHKVESADLFDISSNEILDNVH